MADWSQLLLDIREEDYLDWIKWLDEIWAYRDSKRLKDLPIILNETQEWYTNKGEYNPNSYAVEHGKVPRKTKVGRTLGKWAFIYDRPVAELEKRIFNNTIWEFTRASLNSRIEFSEEAVRSLVINDNDCVVCSERMIEMLPRFDHILNTDYSKDSDKYVIIIKGFKGVEINWSFRPVFHYGPKDFTTNEYRYHLTREHVDIDKYECILIDSALKKVSK